MLDDMHKYLRGCAGGHPIPRLVPSGAVSGNDGRGGDRGPPFDIDLHLCSLAFRPAHSISSRKSNFQWRQCCNPGWSSAHLVDHSASFAAAPPEKEVASAGRNRLALDSCTDS
jgi:hypothetical protein